jgi:short-chain 2-methylacyl-CoA dehydrogenase
MDEAGVFRKDIIRQFFEMGLMGIEIPEEYGGRAAASSRHSGGGRTFRGGSFGRRDRRRAEHHRQQRASALGQRRAEEAKYLPRLATDTVASYALSEAGSGSDAFALATRAVDAATISCSRPQAVDHQRRRSRLFLLFANADPAPDTKASRRF